MVGQENCPLGAVILRLRLQVACMGLGKFPMDQIKPRLHLPQRNKRQNWLGILIRAERRVGPKLVGGLEQPPGKVLKVNILGKKPLWRTGKASCVIQTSS